MNRESDDFGLRVLIWLALLALALTVIAIVTAPPARRESPRPVTASPVVYVEAP